MNHHPYRDRGRTTDPMGEVKKMQYTNISCYEIIISKYKEVSVRIYQRLESSGPRAEGVPNNTERGRGSVP